MTTYAALTDGTTTITFASPGSLGWYRIETGWTPKVATLRSNQMGGRGPYEDVSEEVPISIGGSNAAHLYANAQTLTQLLDQSNRWYRGDNATAVLFKYSPEGATISSTGSPLQAPTWDTDLDLSAGWADFPQAGGAVWMTGAQMRFTRPGLWFHNSASGSGSGVNGASTAVTVAVASSPYPGPTKITITNVVSGSSNALGGAASALIPAGYLVFAEDTSTVQFFNMEGAGSSSKWSIVAAGITSGSAVGGSVLRYTPSDTTESVCAYQAITLTGRRYFALANVRVGGSQSTATMRASIGVYNSTAGATYSSQSYASGVLYVGPPTQYESKWVSLGAVQAPVSGSSYFAIGTAVTGGSVVDFDSAVLIDTTRPFAVIPFYNTFYSAASAQTVTIDPNALTYFSASSAYGSSALTVDADAYVTTKAGSVYCYVLATGCTASGGSTTVDVGFRQGLYDLASGSMGGIYTNTITLTRTAAYLTPV